MREEEREGERKKREEEGARVRERNNPLPAVGGGFLRPEGFENPLESSPSPSLTVPFRLVIHLMQIA